jgi:C1A family cysteine protease
MFLEFKKKYNKTYSNQIEKVKFNTWQERTYLMRKHNKPFEEGEKTYRKGENAMFDMTLKEIEEDYMGLSFIPNYSPRKDSRVSVDISELPSSINWVEKGYVTSVKNQSGCGSCWAHSAAGALEGAYKKDTNRLVNMDVSYLITCSTAYGCKGAHPGIAFTHVQYNGITVDNETDRSSINSFHKTQYIHEKYRNIANHSSHADQHSMKRKRQCELDNINAVVIRNVVLLKKGREEELMQAVAEVGPVSVIICAPLDLVDYAGEDDVFYEENCSEACSKKHRHVNHAALVVGYGEQINKITNENESYWLVKNSWGTDWGNKVVLS